MKKILFLSLLPILTVLLACEEDEVLHSALAKTPNDAEHLDKPYVVMVSIDGFRWDYPELHGASNIARIGTEGIRASRMIPSYPSKTFPNHYTIVTGMEPAEHGLVSNEFYSPARETYYKIKNRKVVEDGSWYGGIPLWSLAESQGMRTASYFWVGSEAEIAGYRPSHYLKYNQSLSRDERVDQVINWLEMPKEVRPHLIMLYFSLVDNAGHDFGPEAPETKEAVREADRIIGQLDARLASLDLPIHLMIVSDHGMVNVDRQHPVSLDALVGEDEYIISRSMPAMLYGGDSARNARKVAELNDVAEGRYHAYLKGAVPDTLYTVDNENIGDIILAPVPPYVFGEDTPGVATHGYFSGYPEMGAYFSVKGPAIPAADEQLPAFSNVHVYPMVSKLLGLDYAHEISGADSVLAPYIDESVL